MEYYNTTHIFDFDDVPDDVLDEWSDAVLDELMTLDVIDAEASGSFSEHRVIFEFAVPAESAEDVFEQAAVRMRTALVNIGTLGRDRTASRIEPHKRYMAAEQVAVAR